MWDYVLFIAGLGILIKSADLFVDGAASIARSFNVSGLIIGLTVVAFGTSAPELFISAMASVQGNPEIALGNVIGSNIANLLLILGMAAVMGPLVFKPSTTLKELPISILATLALWLMAGDIWINQRNTAFISRTDGLLLLCMFGFFLTYLFILARTDRAIKVEKPETFSTPKSIFLLVAGLGGLILGGHMTVDNAIAIASRWRVSQSLIGLTIIAVGTSLPELATTLTATRKKNADIAIGNIVGSNIFNILLILGVSATIHPLPVLAAQQPDFIIMIITGLILLGLVFFGKRNVMERWQGLAFLTLYGTYLVYKVLTDISVI